MDPNVGAALDRIRSYVGRGRVAPLGPMAHQQQQQPTPAFYQAPSYNLTSSSDVSQYGALTPIVNRSAALSRGGATTPPAPKSALKPSGVDGPPSDSINSKDMFLHIVSFLRERYGDPSPASPLAELSDDDVSELVLCFHKELRKVSGKSAVIVHDPKTPIAQRQDSAAVASTVVTTAEVKHDPELSPARTVNSAPALSGASAAAPAVPQSLKESMSLLRAGCFAIKYSSKGAPARKHFRVQNCRSLIEGEMMSVPHFCWAPTPAEEPTGEYSLLTLTGVSSGPSSTTLAAAKKNGGNLVGPNKEPIDTSGVLSVIFGADRTVDVALPSVAHCRAWEKALRFVIERNKRL